MEVTTSAEALRRQRAALGGSATTRACATTRVERRAGLETGNAEADAAWITGKAASGSDEAPAENTRASSTGSAGVEWRQHAWTEGNGREHGKPCRRRGTRQPTTREGKVGPARVAEKPVLTVDQLGNAGRGKGLQVEEDGRKGLLDLQAPGAGAPSRRVEPKPDGYHRRHCRAEQECQTVITWPLSGRVQADARGAVRLRASGYGAGQLTTHRADRSTPGGVSSTNRCQAGTCQVAARWSSGRSLRVRAAVIPHSEQPDLWFRKSRPTPGDTSSESFVVGCQRKADGRKGEDERSRLSMGLVETRGRTAGRAGNVRRNLRARQEEEERKLRAASR